MSRSTQTDSLKGARPLIYVRAFAWSEMRQSQCQCEDPLFRECENFLRHRLYWSALADDSIFEPWVMVRATHTCTGWGVDIRRTFSNEERGSWKLDYAVKEEADVGKLRVPRHEIDEEKTAQDAERMNEAIGDIVTVNVDRQPAYHMWDGDISTILGHLRGIENVMMDKGGFVELPGFCEKAEDLRKLVGKENFYGIFKDDHVAHLYTLCEGGDAPVDVLERIAEALQIKVNLRDPKTRAVEAKKLHIACGLRSTMFLLGKLRAWAEEQNRKLMVLLSYDVPTVKKYIETGERFDQDIVDYLNAEGFTHVDTLPKMAEEFRAYDVSVDAFLERLHVARAGAQVFGHYNPYGNFWFAYAIRKELVNWLDPKPPAYHTSEAST